jgi:hypothetical protein
MALTQADLDALDRAIASSELEVEQDGKRVRYASFSDLKARREFVSGLLATSGSGAPRATGSFQFDFTTRRGD